MMETEKKKRLLCRVKKILLQKPFKAFTIFLLMDTSQKFAPIFLLICSAMQIMWNMMARDFSLVMFPAVVLDGSLTCMMCETVGGMN